MVSDRGLPGQHDRVGPVEYRIGDVRGLRTGRPALIDHGVEHLRRGDDGGARVLALPDDALLYQGDVLEGALDAEIPAGDHHAVGRVDDPTEILDRVGALDFRDDRDVRPVALDHLAHREHVAAIPNETRSHEVDFLLHCEREIPSVLLGDHVQPEIDARNVDPLSGTEFAASVDVGDHRLVEDALDRGLDPAVVE
jgi:hypothetical protein